MSHCVCNSPEPDGHRAPTETLSQKLRHPGAVVRAVPSRDACSGLFVLHKSLAIHPEASEAEPVTPRCLPSRESLLRCAAVADPHALSLTAASHGELQSGGKSPGHWGASPSLAAVLFMPSPSGEDPVSRLSPPKFDSLLATSSSSLPLSFSPSSLELKT